MGHYGSPINVHYTSCSSYTFPGIHYEFTKYSIFHGLAYRHCNANAMSDVYCYLYPNRHSIRLKIHISPIYYTSTGKDGNYLLLLFMDINSLFFYVRQRFHSCISYTYIYFLRKMHENLKKFRKARNFTWISATVRSPTVPITLVLFCV